MRINKIYINNFKEYSYGYLFMISKGTFLLFDKDTLEYRGLFYHFTSKNMNKLEEEAINKLISLDYLEV